MDTDRQRANLMDRWTERKTYPRKSNAANGSR